MSFDQTARDSQMDRSRRSIWSGDWERSPELYDAPVAEPPVTEPPVHRSDMERILREVQSTRDRPEGASPSASELAYGPIDSLRVDAARPAGKTAHAPTTRHVRGRNTAHADWRALAHTLENSAIQLKLASTHLADWKLNYFVGDAMRWVDKHHDVIAATPDKTLEAWAPIIAAQSEILFDAGSDIAELTAAAKRSGIRPADPEAAPYHDVLEKFGVAIDRAHQAENPKVHLDAARQAKARLPLELLEGTLRENRSQTREMVALVPNVKDEFGINRVENAQAAVSTLDAGAMALRDSFDAGKDIDPVALEGIALGAKEQIIIARSAILDAKIDALVTAVETSTEGVIAGNANLLNEDIAEVRHALFAVRPELSAIVPRMRREAVPEGPFPANHAEGQEMFARARRTAVANANATLAKLRAEHKLDALFRKAVGSIEHANRNTVICRLLVDIAALIGISIVTGGIASAAGGVVRGAVMADAAIDAASFARTAMVARTAGAVTHVAVDASLQALGQKAVQGHGSVAENAIANVLTLTVLRPFHTALGELGHLDAKTLGLWKVASGGKVVLAAAATLTVETLVGAGAAYVAKSIVEGKPPPDTATATSWAIQGASMAVGKFIHGRMRDLNERWATFGEEKIALLRRARQQERLAEQLQKSGSTEDALTLLDEHVKILKEEQALLDHPASLARLHLDPQQLSVLRRGNAHALTETRSQSLGLMRLRFLGLEPLTAAGDVWSGTRAQIDAVLADAGGAVHHVKPAGQGEWTARMGAEDVKFVEVSHWGVDPADIKRVRQKGDDGHEYQYDAMHPGPLSDPSVYDQGDTGEPLPAQNFYGAKYDEIVLSNDMILYRIGNAEQAWGQWFTNHPLESETHHRIDLAVKRDWVDPKTGSCKGGPRRSSQLELWSYAILVPKGTTIYSGNAGSQGSAYMGGLGSGSHQYFIPKAWELVSKGAKVIAKTRFKRDGHNQTGQTGLDPLVEEK